MEKTWKFCVSKQPYAGPLDAILVNATFVRMRSGDHLGDAKMSKKGASLRRI